MNTQPNGAGSISPAPSLIVAEVGEGGSRDEVRRAAIRLAEEHHARLVFYDADAKSLLADPMPSNWSADGAEDEFGDLLSPDELGVLGRPELRDIVNEARGRGLDAHGWLAGGRGIDSIEAYAERIVADLILIPDEEAERGPLDLGEDEVLEAAHELRSPVRVGLVRDDASVEMQNP